MKREIAREIKRQMFHAVIGLLLGVAIWQEYVDWLFLTFLLVFIAIIAIIHNKKPIRGIRLLFDELERPKKVPGFGAFLMVFGMLLASLLYPPQIAGAAILILAFGDSASTIFGKTYGEIKLTHNRKKSLEGSLSGFLFAVVAAQFVVGLELAFLGAFVGMFFESFNDRVGLDDNVIIPVVAGLAMMLAL